MLRPPLRHPAVLALILGLVPVASAHPQSPVPPTTRVVTVGTGRVTLTPTTAQVTISIETRDSTASRASTEAERRLQEVRTRLGQIDGVDSIRVISVRVNLQEDDNERVTGYSAQATVMARVRDLSRLGALFDAALGAGATGIGPVNFHADGLAQARSGALKMAYSEARAEAESLAAAAGLRLGRAVTITSAPVSSYGFGFEEASIDAGEPHAAFGNGGSGYISLAPSPADVVITRTVRIEWALEE